MYVIQLTTATQAQFIPNYSPQCPEDSVLETWAL